MKKLLAFTFIALFFVSCGFDIKDFVQKELARDRSTTEVYYYDQLGQDIGQLSKKYIEPYGENDYIETLYLPSEELITAKIPIKNELNIPLIVKEFEIINTSLPNKDDCFATPPVN